MSIAIRKAPATTPTKKLVAEAGTNLLPRGVKNLLVTVLLLIVVIPTVYVAVASTMPDVDVASGKLLPESFDLSNYVKIWTTVSLGTGIMNSILVCGMVAITCGLLSVVTAYGLVRFAFKGKLAILRGLIALQSIPGTLLLLPVFVLYSSAGTYLNLTIVGTRPGLFLTYLTFALPFSTWIMVTYLRGLPIEFEEAARIDGCSTFGLLWRVIIPLSWPGIIVSSVFAFLHGWNDVLFASVLTTTDTQTASVVLEVFGAAQDGGAVPLYGQLMASSLICAAPVVILYLIFQRFLVGGLTAGGVK